MTGTVSRQGAGVSLMIPAYSAPSGRKNALSASPALRGLLYRGLGTDLRVELGDLGLQGCELGDPRRQDRSRLPSGGFV